VKCCLGIGTNLGDRRANLERAAALLLEAADVTALRTSPVFESPALVPAGAPGDWHLPFLNAAIEIEWRSSPDELLRLLKKIERELGRAPAPRWAPRLLDLDILTFGSELIHAETLRIPHPEMTNRQFVLGPFSHLQPSLKLPGSRRTILETARELADPLPLWMGILNITPDSFSDGGELSGPAALDERLASWDEENVAIFDLGAESTRPQAQSLTTEEEWRRLEPALERVRDRYRGRHFRPWLSVDTYHASTAARALAAGADLINDVSGLSDDAMLEVVRASRCQYVLMHSLTVPADPRVHLDENLDPATEIKSWARHQLEKLAQAGIALDRVIFDPGIGFNKTARQSLECLQRIDEFFDLPVRILVGHSRKTFLHGSPEIHAPAPAKERDLETLGVSLQLAERGVPVLRVHSPDHHQRALRALRVSRRAP